MTAAVKVDVKGKNVTRSEILLEQVRDRGVARKSRGTPPRQKF